MSYKTTILFFLLSTKIIAAPCVGHFVNPITDVCWRCLFPISIGAHNAVGSSLADTENAANSLHACQSDIGARVGLNIGYFEPSYLVDVTDAPYCMVNLGGIKIPLGAASKRGGRQTTFGASAFYHVHFYKYPLISWLNLIGSAGCKQSGGFDIAYLSELDPTWYDSEMSFILNPEAILFANPAAAASCAADSLSSSINGRALDKLFWCAGSQGSHYPLTGHVSAALSPVQTALLLTERMNYKLHRTLPLILDTNAKSPCTEHHIPILPKSRYRYSMVNQVPDGKHCYAPGSATLFWEFNKIKPHTPSQYGFLVWRKRNCVYL